MELRTNKNSLHDGYMLHWYEIQKVIGRGGFGITYLAHDTNLERDVAIKEFMPEEFAVRESDSTVHPKTGDQEKLYSWGLDRFIAEARTLAKFNHPNIVRVQSVFEENNTAYMVMEYAVGKDLSKVYKNEPKFTEEQLLDTFIPILDGLSLVHNAGFIHRDIKPANIYICRNNAPLLLDFGSARQSMGGKTKALTSLVTIGYAPYEQYNEGSGKQGPWTDIYALGASIYVGITGKKPIDALFRGGSFLEKGLDTYEPVSVLAKGEYSDNFLLAVDKALMFKIEERPKNILLWADMLLGKIVAPPLPDYMLNPPVIDEATELSWSDTELGYSTEISKNANSGTQGLVDAHGKRTAGDLSSVIKNKDVSAVDNGMLETIIKKPENRKIEKTQNSRLPIVLSGFAVLCLVVFMFWLFSDSSDSVEVGENKSAIESRKPVVEQVDKKKIKLNSLLDKAKQSENIKNYVKPNKNNAYYFYQAALKIEGDNEVAIKGLKNIENQLLRLVNLAYEKNQYEATQKYLDHLKLIGSNSIDVKFLQDQLDVINEKDREVALSLVHAEKQLKNEQFIKPESDNAFYTYNKVLKQQPDNQRALEGIKNIQKYYVSMFEKNISKFRLVEAEKNITVMKQIRVSSADIEVMQRALKQSYKKQSAQKSDKPRKKIVKKSVVKKTVSNKIKIKKLDIHQVSKLIGQFKAALQERNTKKIKQMSQFVQGRSQFVEQLHKQYRKINVRVSNLNLIAKEKRAKAVIELTDLIDKNGNKVTPGNWSKFEIILRYNKQNQLRVYW
ncbi:MAG: hypothetical protein DIZ80_09150 [endosymbiont of Galathealinum brachiosum]|uniref:non-specific serine/threonine protein kinase n=1 Tax=endosymbiont of Galathealinum brachiosum TaxID=2200906 RepID=A0A370DC17_9GAMM|nr:MAG: hypothetical protein DIZ80_09150 [endosymbiont of Galathealinum brachiosum]